MKKCIFFLFIIFIFPINANAYSEIVMDKDSNRVLFGKNIYDKSLIASTTKIMTSIIAIENGNLNDKYVVGNEIKEVYGSSMYLSIGEKISLKELLYGLLLRSGNDAAVVIANNVCRNEKEFINLMNEKVKELKLKNTIFSNPHGLDNKNENISTAYDLAIIMKYAMGNKTFVNISKKRVKKFKTNKNKYTLYNKNLLLNRYKYNVSGKTGYTSKAGYTFVSFSKKGKTSLIVVTLGEKNRFNRHMELYKKYFNNYKTYKVIDKDKIKDENKKYKKCKLYLKDDVFVALKQEEIKNVNVNIKLLYKKNKNIVGHLHVLIGNKDIVKKDVYCKRKIWSFFK